LQKKFKILDTFFATDKYLDFGHNSNRGTKAIYTLKIEQFQELIFGKMSLITRKISQTTLLHMNQTAGQRQILNQR